MNIKEAREFLYSINKINLNIPDEAYNIVYSTWYNFHQNFNRIIKNCQSIWNKSIIIDDDWQTDDSNRGYSYCGDWIVSRTRFYDFK